MLYHKSWSFKLYREKQVPKEFKEKLLKKLLGRMDELIESGEFFADNKVKGAGGVPAPGGANKDLWQNIRYFFSFSYNPAKHSLPK